MLSFGESKLAKEKIYAVKQPINIWDVNVNNIIISRLIEIKTNSKYLFGYLNKVIRTLLLIFGKINPPKNCTLKFKRTNMNLQ